MIFSSVRYAVVALLSLCLVACGGGGSDSSAGNSPPLVTQTLPFDNATGFAINESILITFSSPMDRAATESAVSISPVVDGSYTWSASDTVLTFTPGADLSTKTTYSVTIATGAMDAGMTPLASEAAFAFTTGYPVDNQLWTGTLDFYLTGIPLATDSNADSKADILSLPAVMSVTAAEVPADAQLAQAFLLWSGTQAQAGADCASLPDDTVTYISPLGTSKAVTADSCSCSNGAATYDIWTCKADVTWQVTLDGIHGSHSIDDYAGKIENAAEDNGSAAVMFVYEAAGLSSSYIRADSVLTQLQSSSYNISLQGNPINPNVTAAALGYYTIGGDAGGTGTEQVSVVGLPGTGLYVALTDSVNPIDNPMNGTINTAPTPLAGLVGVDIDVFDISSAVGYLDSSVDVTYQAGTDEWWHVLTVVDIEY